MKTTRRTRQPMKVAARRDSGTETTAARGGQALVEREAERTYDGSGEASTWISASIHWPPRVPA